MKRMNVVAVAAVMAAMTGVGFAQRERRVLEVGSRGVVEEAKAVVVEGVVPEGNWRVRVRAEGRKEGGVLFVKAEQRRLMVEGVKVGAGEVVERAFVVNVRRPEIGQGSGFGVQGSVKREEGDEGKVVRVKLNEREVGSRNWDEKLSLEFLGKGYVVRGVEIEQAEDAVTVFLAGDSTVTDQKNEPWGGWGQMLPRFFKDGVAVANHAESGRALKSFQWEGRFDKVFGQMKKGDYLFIQFAHNDQKPGSGHAPAMGEYKELLKKYVAQTRERGATPVLVTSMHRRRFEGDKVVQTLGDYPEAVRQVGKEEGVAVIDLNEMSKALYEALGPVESKKAFVHYPAGTFPGQEKELKDDTHHNGYGGYQLARCVVEGIRTSGLPLAKMLDDSVGPFDPGQPDPVEAWAVPASPFATASPTPEGR